MKGKSMLKKEENGFRQMPSLSKLRAGFAGFLLVPAFLAGSALTQNAQSLSPQSSNVPSVESRIPTAPVSYAGIVEKAAPAVVTVRSERRTAGQSSRQMPFSDEMLREFFGGRMPQTRQSPRVQRGLGSGVIVSADGTILTNNHVVNDASQVQVELPDKRVFTAKVVGTDPASDLAVLKIEAQNLPTMPFGNSDSMRVGDVVLAIGNPLGLRQTVTSGIISAKGRQTGVSDGSFEDFLQTDAPINTGNSGGALVSLNGELIGINSQILSPSGGSIGIGFAIPSNMAKSVMTQLIANGKVRRGQLGVGIQDVNSSLAENFGLKEIRGVVVNSITPGGSAEKAGIQRGDVILSLNGTPINDGNELRNRVAQTAPNTTLDVGILRNGQSQTVKATLGELQPTASRNEENPAAPSAAPTDGKLGLSLQPVTPQVAQRLKLNTSSGGLIVGNVQPGSPADDAGIEQGDVILEINRQPVKNITDVSAAMNKKTGNSALLLINRDGQTLFVSVQL